MTATGRAVGWLVLLMVLMAVAVAGIWWSTGGRWARVETPSMGTQAPVGSLVLTRPARVSDLTPGDLVTFRSPSDPDTTYTHLVLSRSGESFTTRGGLSGPDDWEVHQRQLVGRTVAIWPGVGWVTLMLPLLIVGAVAVALAARHLPRRHRLAAVVLGATLVLSAALLTYRPLTRADQLSFETKAYGAKAVWVNTGVLPLRVTAADGRASAVMRSGEVAAVQVVHQVHGRYVVHVRPDLPWWWWPLVLVPCLLPALIETLRRHRRRGVGWANAAGAPPVASSATESPQSSQL